LNKVKEVIYQIGLEDKTIVQKIKVIKINVEIQTSKPNNREQLIDEFGEYDDELTNQLRLKTQHRTTLGITYEKARKITALHNIMSKNSYYELCVTDNRLSKEPEVLYNTVFTNWIEYLSIDRIYYDLETCKQKVSEYLSTKLDCSKYNLNLSHISIEVCNMDSSFPPAGLWCEYYNVGDLSDIITLPRRKNKHRII
jgi:hypothetical protein